MPMVEWNEHLHNCTVLNENNQFCVFHFKTKYIFLGSERRGCLQYVQYNRMNYLGLKLGVPETPMSLQESLETQRPDRNSQLVKFQSQSY